MILLLTGEVSGTVRFAGGLSLAVSAIAAVVGVVFLRGERSRSSARAGRSGRSASRRICS